MKRKAEYPVRIIDDEIVRNCLSATSVLGNSNSYVVVGGVAVQSYLPSSCRRPTADIDIAVGRPLTTRAEFHEFVRPVAEYLQDHKFSVKYFYGKSRSWVMEVVNPSKEEIYFGFSKDTQKSFKEKEIRRRKKLESARLKTVEERTDVYRVASPEFIIVPKFVRLGNILMQYPDFNDFIAPYQHKMTDELIRETRNRIDNIRAKLLVRHEPRLESRNVAICDAYDIRILFEIPGVNEKDLKEAFELWSTDFIPKDIKKALIPLLPGAGGLEELLIKSDPN